MGKRNLSEPLRAAVESVMSELHVCLPGRIERYDHIEQRAEVKPLLRRSYRDGDESDMPVIADVPVIWPRAGGASLTMPVKQGDGVLLVFADRSIDRWLVQGGEVTPDDRRKHDLSDCVAIPGLYSFVDESPQDNNEDVLLQYEGSSVRLTGDGNIETETDGDHSVSISGAHTMDVEGDHSVSISGAHTVTGGGNIKIETDGDHSISVSGAHTVTVEGNVKIIASGSVIIQGATVEMN